MNRDLRLLSVSLFIWGIGEGLFFYFQPLYLQKLGASPEVIGVILGIGGLVLSLSHIPAGAAADRFGRRPVMWASWLTGLVAAWTMALARSLPVFAAGAVLYNLSAFVIAPLNSYVTAARGRWSVQRALTITSASFNAGAVAGSLIGGQLGQRLGLAAIYQAAALIFMVSVVVVLFVHAQPVVPPESRGGAGRGRRFSARFWGFMGFVFLVMLVLYLPQPLAPNFLQNVRHASLGDIGTLGALARGGMVVISLVLGSFGAWEGFLLAQISGGLFALLIWKGSSMWVYSAAYFFAGGYWASKAMAAAEVRSMVAEAAMGLAYGLNETMGGLAVFLASTLAGWMYARAPESVFRWTVGLLPLLLLGNLPFHPRWGRKVS